MKPMNRRETIAASVLLSLAGLSSAKAQSGSTILVAYLSRTGNTRLIARQISAALSADLFEIETAQPYPDNYEAMVDQASRERTSGFEPPLKGRVTDIAQYRTVFLGLPIWGMSAPSPIRSFLSSHGLAGKTLVPFITNGGFGVGNAMDIVREHARGAEIREPLVRQYEPERDILNQVTGWLGGVRL